VLSLLLARSFDLARVLTFWCWNIRDLDQDTEERAYEFLRNTLIFIARSLDTGVDELAIILEQVFDQRTQPFYVNRFTLHVCIYINTHLCINHFHKFLAAWGRAAAEIVQSRVVYCTVHVFGYTLYSRMCLRMRTHARVHTHAHTYMHTHTYIHIYMYMYILCVYMYIYICVYINIHILLHVLA